MKIGNHIFTAILLGIFASNSYATEFNDPTFAVGTYRTTTIKKNFPLLFRSTDQSRSWISVPDMTTDLPIDFIDRGHLDSVSCNPDFCIAVGSYNAIPDTDDKVLLTVSTDQGKSWSYRSTQPDFYKHGAGYGNAHSACNNQFCIVALTYWSTKDSRLLPLIAISKDKGVSWNYPESVISQLPKNYDGGNLESLYCEKDICIGVGGYDTDATQLSSSLPLITISKNQGLSWEYPSIPLPPDAEDTILFAAKCYSDFCIAVGSYGTPDEKRHPFIVRSTDKGSTWTYIKSDHKNEYTFSLLTSIHCEKGTCITSGSGRLDSTFRFDIPMLAMSYDNGVSWTYPSTILSNLPPESKDACMNFDSSACHDNVCMAAGTYWLHGVNTLIAVSHDRGINWSYVDPIAFPGVASADVDVDIISLVFRDNKWILTGNYARPKNNKLCTRKNDYIRFPFVAISENDGVNWKLSTMTLPMDYISGYLVGDQTWPSQKTSTHLPIQESRTTP